MTQNKFHQAGNDSKTKSGGIKLIATIAVVAVSVPLHGHDLRSSVKQPSEPSMSNSVEINQRPVANADFVDLEKSATAFNILANDSDADGDSLIIIEAIANFGAVAFTPEGLLAYAQNPGSTRPDKITYTVSDGRGGHAKGLVEVSVKRKAGF